MVKLHVCTRCLMLLKKQKNIHFEILKFKSKITCNLCREKANENEKSMHVIKFEDAYLGLILHKTKFIEERCLALADKLNEALRIFDKLDLLQVVDNLDTHILKFQHMTTNFGKEFGTIFINQLNTQYKTMVEGKITEKENTSKETKH